MKQLNTNMPIHMMMGTTYTATTSAPQVYIAIGIGTNQRVINTHMCQMPIICTLIDSYSVSNDFRELTAPG